MGRQGALAWICRYVAFLPQHDFTLACPSLPLLRLGCGSQSFLISLMEALIRHLLYARLAIPARRCMPPASSTPFWVSRWVGGRVGEAPMREGMPGGAWAAGRGGRVPASSARSWRAARRAQASSEASCRHMLQRLPFFRLLGCLPLSSSCVATTCQCPFSARC